MPYRMKRQTKLQFLGPAALFVFVLAGEAAAWGLGHTPTSGFLWYANLQIFPVLQKSYYLLSAHVDISHFQLYFIALPIFARACYWLVAARSLPISIARNLQL